MKFEELDKKIQDWLSSELVTGIIVAINEQLNTVGPEVKVIPQTVRSLVTSALKPELFAQQLKKGLFFLEDQDIANAAGAVKERILKPIAAPLKSLYGVDINKLSLTPPPSNNRPTARTMTVEGDIGKMSPRAQPAPTPKTSAQVLEAQQLRARTMQVEGEIIQTQRLAQQQAAGQRNAAAANQAGPTRARTMEIQGSFAPVERSPKAAVKNMVDIKKPVSQTPAGGAAQVTQIQGSFTPVTPTANRPASVPTSTSAPMPKKPERGADVLETTTPIDLSEVMPQAPTQPPTPKASMPKPRLVFVEEPAPLSSATPQELVKYQDEHPMVE